MIEPQTNAFYISMKALLDGTLDESQTSHACQLIADLYDLDEERVDDRDPLKSRPAAIMEDGFISQD